MSTLTFLPEHVWQSPEFPLCTVNVPVAELAQRLGFPLVTWDESGLGNASGFGCKLESGMVLLLEELAHAREYLGAAGPTIYVEASALVAQGVGTSVTSVLNGLGLSPQNVTWSQDASGLQSAERITQSTKTVAAPSVVPNE